MLEKFINEYKNKFLLDFSDDFAGEFAKFKAVLLEPKMHASGELVAKLNELNALIYEPMQVAIVGQFSSGKSSFLNALLGQNLLPTGVIPVTAKPTYIKYAPCTMLKALYNDGREEYKDISHIASFVDQRGALADVKSLSIYLPNELLKSVTFIDTPGLNSRSDSDTKETLEILKKVGGLVWISLIDNAARASELSELEAIPQNLKKSSICLLNQKDKLNNEEISRVLTHAKKTYTDSFDEVLAISAKLEISGSDESGFELVKQFLRDKIIAKKENFIVDEAAQISQKLICQYEFFIRIYEKMQMILSEFSEYFDKKSADFLEIYKNEFIKFYAKIKEISNSLSDEILKHISQTSQSYYVQSKTLMGKKVEKITYEAPYLNADEALSKLIYNDDKLSREFKKLRRELDEFCAKINKEMGEVLESLVDKTLIFKGEFETIRKTDEIYSQREFSEIRKFASEVYGLFLAGFERAMFEFSEKNSLFFDKLIIKIATNYENAIKLSVAFFDDKIKRSISAYEDDPQTFSLYYPKKDEILARILTNLNYFEFENDFIGRKPFIQKNIENLTLNFKELESKNLAYLNALKSRHEENIAHLQSTSLIFNLLE
ncbi:dynamin family protein [Campylobacter geochelonis]|uniref:dynamin family protein n=1 Tax=Campylobacter geochelonis TaxID=1780362 RepID=UPI000770B66C|nr:dynamin family protein [Campylobacter geochelonis]CZE47800.1 GTP-binding protein [Campylobacter geochelonis]